MCGIVFAHHKRDKVNGIIYRLFNHQLYRGLEGFGMMGVKNGRVFYRKEDIPEKAVTHLIERQSNTVLFHHRQPTNNSANGNHPYLVNIDDVVYATVHNGYIHNSDRLKDEDFQGYELVSGDKDYNDSEILAIDVAEYLAGVSPKLRCEGMIAFVTWQVRNGKLEKVWFGRNQYAPLEKWHTDVGLVLASDIKQRAEYVAEDTLYCYDPKRNTLLKSPLEFPERPTIGFKTNSLNEPTIDRLMNGEILDWDLRRSELKYLTDEEVEFLRDDLLETKDRLQGITGDWSQDQDLNTADDFENVDATLRMIDRYVGFMEDEMYIRINPGYQDI